MTGLVGALIGSLGFGSANVVIKKSLSSLSIPQTLMMSTLSGAACLFIFAVLTGNFAPPAIPVILAAAGLSLVEVVLYLMLYKTFAISNVTVATAVMGVYPLLSTLFTVFVLTEPLPLYKFGFISLLVLGGIVTSINWDDVFTRGFERSDIVKGIGWIVATTLIHALYFPLLGHFTAEGSWPTKLVLIKIFSAITLFVYFAVIKKQRVLPPKEMIPFTSLLGFLEMTGWAGFSWATNSTKGQTAILIATLNSSALVTAVLAYFFLSEKLSTFQYLGIGIIIAGLTGLSL